MSQNDDRRVFLKSTWKIAVVTAVGLAASTLDIRFNQGERVRTGSMTPPEENGTTAVAGKGSYTAGMAEAQAVCGYGSGCAGGGGQCGYGSGCAGGGGQCGYGSGCAGGGGQCGYGSGCAGQ